MRPPSRTRLLPVPLLLAALVVSASCATGETPGGETRSADAAAGSRPRWRSLAPVPTPRTEVTAAALPGRIYVIGGFARGGETTPAVEVYSVAGDSWSDGPDLPLALNHAMAATLDGQVYVAGGYRGPGVDNPTDRAFRLAGDSWEEIAPLPEPRAAGALVPLKGRLYLAGGVGGNGLADETFVYNPRTSSWKTRRALPHSRQHLGGAKAGGRMYVVGGRTEGLSSNTGRSHRYNPGTRSWKRIADMPTPRGGLAAAAALGLVVAAGGEADETFDEVEAFDVRQRRWRRLPDMPTARHGVGVVTVGTRVYVLAGGPEPGLSYSGANEMLNLEALRD